MKNAIEHLGHESDSVRLGGTYELFHLAEDAEDVGQRQTVLDILCAHIRWTTSEPQYREKHRSKPSEEIQSLLILLFVREHKVFAGLDINLEGSWLNGSDLSRARLEGANLWGVQLGLANLWRAQLCGASLIGAQLHSAGLIEVQLHGANLWGAELHGANLMGAQLCGTNLFNAELQEAHLIGVDLRGAFCLPIYPQEPFEASINERIGWESALAHAIFAGGLTTEAVASIGTGLSDGEAKKLRESLAAHIGKPVSYELPEDSDVSTGAYTKEEADRWIAAYRVATKAVSGGD